MMRSYWSRAVPSSNKTGVFKREKRYRDKNTGRMSCGHRGRGWNDASTSQGRPTIAGPHQKLEEARKDSPQKV